MEEITEEGQFVSLATTLNTLVHKELSLGSLRCEDGDGLAPTGREPTCELTELDNNYKAEQRPTGFMAKNQNKQTKNSPPPKKPQNSTKPQIKTKTKRRHKTSPLPTKAFGTSEAESRELKFF